MSVNIFKSMESVGDICCKFWNKIIREDSDIEVFELEEHSAAQKLNCFL